MNSSYATNNSNVFHVYLHSQPPDLNQTELLHLILHQQQSSITTIRPPNEEKVVFNSELVLRELLPRSAGASWLHMASPAS